MPISEYITLKVYDINGKEVAILIEVKVEAGYHTIEFIAGNIPSGLYFYKIESEKVQYDKENASG